MSEHTIRLAGPWQRQCEPGNGQRVRLPVERQPGEDLQLARRFGRPGRLDPGERVWLMIAGLSGPTQITLNQSPLELETRTDGLGSDITDRLVADNWLSIRWLGTDSGGLAGPVWLECLGG
jgi:hypothetical protein